MVTRKMIDELIEMSHQTTIVQQKPGLLDFLDLSLEEWERVPMLVVNDLFAMRITYDPEADAAYFYMAVKIDLPDTRQLTEDVYV